MDKQYRIWALVGFAGMTLGGALFIAHYTFLGWLIALCGAICLVIMYLKSQSPPRR
jgi:hypothetical protein